MRYQGTVAERARPPAPNRRQALTGGAAIAAAALGARSRPAHAQPDADQAGWEAFKSRFVHSDGRVIDDANGGISHSEGQSYGLLLAVAHDDQSTFDRLLAWTASTLRRPADSLHAWRYIPAHDPPVTDLNNASDGDLVIALSLARAARRWGRPDHLQAARAIVSDIRRLLVCEAGARLVLLPGGSGFATADSVVVNPSYYMFPALREALQLDPWDGWRRLAADGAELIDHGRFGRWRLPPDWLAIDRRDGRLAPAPGWPARCGFDAIRVPLFLTWGGVQLPDVMTAFAAFWSAFPPDRIPAWADLTDETLAPYPASAGMRAIMRVASPRLRDAQDSAAPAGTGAATDYYSAALTLLASLAAAERGANTSGPDGN